MQLFGVHEGTQRRAVVAVVVAVAVAAVVLAVVAAKLYREPY